MNGNKTEKQVIGKIGEDAVCKYLKKRDFYILDRNYLKKWGELDIVAKKGEIVHFIEVKSISREIKKEFSRETSVDSYRAEDNLHLWKTKRLKKIIETYILDKDFDEDQDWQIDIATVSVDMSKRICRVSLIEDIVL
jgi:putative endonuclease